MKKIQHFLLTRFNVRVNYDSERTGIEPTWLSHRFDLFERFCYPSVRAQTNLDFQWLVYFDSETPPIFKERIDRYAEWENFIPIYLETEFSDQINQENVFGLIKKKTKYLITTRMDNDDAVCKNFIQSIQENFEEKEFEFISFINGYVLETGKLYSFKYINNPFTSLVERIKSTSTDEIRTILCGEHSQLSALGNIKQIETDSTWLQVVHGKNVSNRIRGVRQPIRKLLDNNRFIIDASGIPQQDNAWLYWLDKTWSLLKQPIEWTARQFPSRLKTSLKEFLP
jgi:Putative rhamnosyl transferase